MKGQLPTWTVDTRDLQGCVQVLTQQLKLRDAMRRRRRQRLRARRERTARTAAPEIWYLDNLLVWIMDLHAVQVQGGLGAQRLWDRVDDTSAWGGRETAEGLGTAGVFTDGRRRKILGRWHRRSIHNEIMIITTTQVVMLIRDGCSRKARDEVMVCSTYWSYTPTSYSTCGKRCKGRAAVTSHVRDRP